MSAVLPFSLCPAWWRVPLLAGLAAAVLLAQAQAGVAGFDAGRQRLLARYADLIGSEAEASKLITDLRTGGDFTLVEDVETTITLPDGSRHTLTSRVERNVANRTGPMAWEDVALALALARHAVERQRYPDLVHALVGVTRTVTAKDGSTTTAVGEGVLAMRARLSGWSGVAAELGADLDRMTRSTEHAPHARSASSEGVRPSTGTAQGRPVFKLERAR